jgi:peptidoglycan/xylan/chitin deacetylase (PgdA/CDA1 family)
VLATNHAQAFFDMTAKLAKTVLKRIGGIVAFPVSKRLAMRSPRILMYHRFGPKGLDAKIFEAQVRILKSSFNVISLSKLSMSLQQGIPLPAHTVVITVDDGYADFYTYAYPILKKYSMPATFYVVSEFVDRNIWLWPDTIVFVLKNTSHVDYTVRLGDMTRNFRMGNSLERRQAWNDIADYCLTLKNKEKLRFIREVASDLGVMVPAAPVEEFAAVSWADILEMKKSGVEVGSHTCTHPKLTMLDQNELEYELRDSKKRIEEMTDAPTESFCYPNGTRADYDDDIKRMVQRSGYANATVGFFDSKITDDMFALRRYSIGPDMFHFRKVVNSAEFLQCGIREQGWHLLR